MRRRWVAVAGVVVVAGTGTGLGVSALLHDSAPPPPACKLGAGPGALTLSIEQASNASTIAAVAKRLGLPDHAVTIGIATALQESKLVNLPFGDRDSLGLFQQRPSQGWGRPAQLLTPAYAASAFFRHLRGVAGWQALPVAEAAQSVQHSADGAGYAQWEEQARVLARALTGEVPAGLACGFSPATAARPAALRRLGNRELGPGRLGGTGGSAATDWATATWLVAHARGYGIDDVAARGRRWTNTTRTWQVDRTAGSAPTYRFTPAPR